MKGVICIKLWQCTVVVYLLLISFTDADLTEKPEDTVVLVGGTFTLRCRTTLSTAVQMVFYRVRLNYGRKDNIYRTGHIESPDPRFSVNKVNELSGLLILTVHNVSQEDAGEYTCLENESYPDLHKGSAQVAVIEKDGWLCDTNDKVCYERNDYVSLSCSLSYWSNIKPDWVCSRNETIQSTVLVGGKNLTTVSTRIPITDLQNSSWDCKLNATQFVVPKTLADSPYILNFVNNESAVCLVSKQSLNTSNRHMSFHVAFDSKPSDKDPVSLVGKIVGGFVVVMVIGGFVAVIVYCCHCRQYQRNTTCCYRRVAGPYNTELDRLHNTPKTVVADPRHEPPKSPAGLTELDRLHNTPKTVVADPRREPPKSPAGLIVGEITDSDPWRKLLSNERKRILLIRRDDLVCNMNLDDPMPILLTNKHVLSSEMLQDIGNAERREDKVKRLLDLLAQRPDQSFTNFIDVLVKTDQMHVAKLLMDEQSRSIGGIKNSDPRYRLLSNERKHILRSRREDLVRDMNVDSMLILLTNKHVLSLEMLQDIENAETREDKVRRLLDLLVLRPDQSFTDFMNTLVETDQAHVAALLMDKKNLAIGGATDSDPQYRLMSNEHKLILRSRREELVCNINVDPLLNFFTCKRALSPKMLQDIGNAERREDKVRLLLDLLELRPDQSFTDFVDALEMTDQQHVAALLKDE